MNGESTQRASLMAQTMPSAMSIRIVAAYLNVDEKTICRLVQKGGLLGFKVLGSWRFQRPDLGAWIVERKDQAAAKQK
jgi:excisionase family DNA binding protein